MKKRGARGGKDSGGRNGKPEAFTTGINHPEAITKWGWTLQSLLRTSAGPRGAACARTLRCNEDGSSIRGARQDQPINTALLLWPWPLIACSRRGEEDRSGCWSGLNGGIRPFDPSFLQRAHPPSAIRSCLYAGELIRSRLVTSN